MVRASVPQLLVISMWVSGALLAGSGFNDVAGIDRGPGLQGEVDELNKSFEQYNASQEGGDTSYLGATITATTMMVEGFRWALLFPFALINIGFPKWFAFPIGVPVQLVNYWGIWQIIRGFNIR